MFLVEMSVCKLLARQESALRRLYALKNKTAHCVKHFAEWWPKLIITQCLKAIIK